MVATAPVLALPRTQVVAGAGTHCADDTRPTWDIYLNDMLVASDLESEEAARLELDMVVWYTMFGEALLDADVLPSERALDLALLVFDQIFHAPCVRAKARLARTTIIQPEIYTVNSNGSLSVLASSTRGRKGAPRSYAIRSVAPDRHDDSLARGAYHVSLSCECMDFHTRTHDHGGCCKHVAARMLLFLAQQGEDMLRDLLRTFEVAETKSSDHTSDLKQTDREDASASPTDALAFVVLHSTELSASLFLALQSGESATLCACEGDLIIQAGRFRLVFPCQDGAGASALTLGHDALRHLYSALRGAASRTHAVTVFLDSSDGSLVLSGDAFSATSYGEPCTHAVFAASGAQPD